VPRPADAGGAATGSTSPGGGLGRAFWTIWTAATVSAVGDGVRYVAFPLLATSITRDPRAVALLFAAGYLPWPLLGLVGGAVVDRYPPVALLAVVAFVLGAAETVFDNRPSGTDQAGPTKRGPGHASRSSWRTAASSGSPASGSATSTVTPSWYRSTTLGST
jgi:MFS family permease